MPDFGRILIGRASKSVLRPAFGWPEGRFCGFSVLNLAEIRPGNPISGPALLRNMGHKSKTSGPSASKKGTWDPLVYAEEGSCYAVELPDRKSGFRAGFRPDSNRESLNIGPPAGLWPAGGLIFVFPD